MCTRSLTLENPKFQAANATNRLVYEATERGER